MKSYVVQNDAKQPLKLEERDPPSPPGPGEVIVDVKAVSLNYRDLLVVKGLYGGSDHPPFIACSDMSGVVTAVGEGVSEWMPGDQVINSPFRYWPAGTMRSLWARSLSGGVGVDGVLAEQINYPASALVPQPAHLSFEEGATLPVAALTAWAALVTHGKTRPGEWVLLHGTGGVSIFAAQIAKMIGARTIMTSSSEKKADFVKTHFGVHKTVNYKDPDWIKQIKTLTGNNGVDVVVDVVGGDTLNQTLQICNYGARVLTIGVLAGTKSTLNVIDLLQHQVTLRGIMIESTEELRRMAHAFESAGIHPHIDHVFTFDKTEDAYAHLESQKHIGKVVIKL